MGQSEFIHTRENPSFSHFFTSLLTNESDEIQSITGPRLIAGKNDASGGVYFVGGRGESVEAQRRGKVRNLQVRS